MKTVFLTSLFVGIAMAAGGGYGFGNLATGLNYGGYGGAGFGNGAFGRSGFVGSDRSGGFRSSMTGSGGFVTGGGFGNVGASGAGGQVVVVPEVVGTPVGNVVQGFNKEFGFTAGAQDSSAAQGPVSVRGSVRVASASAPRTVVAPVASLSAITGSGLSGAGFGNGVTYGGLLNGNVNTGGQIGFRRSFGLTRRLTSGGFGSGNVGFGRVGSGFGDGFGAGFGVGSGAGGVRVLRVASGQTGNEGLGVTGLTGLGGAAVGRVAGATGGYGTGGVALSRSY